MIADTIIFKYDVPIVWFFSDKHGQVKKKHKNKLLYSYIESCFLKTRNKSGIVAVYIQNHSTSNQIDCQYLDEFSFTRFCRDKQVHTRNGVLQKFIQEKESKHHNCTRVSWSRNVCIEEKIENLNDINDWRIHCAKRAGLFENDFNQVVSTPVKGYKKPNEYENQAFKVVQHIANISNDKLKIVRISLYFQKDSEGHTRLIFCSNIRQQKHFITLGKKK